jgi:hypothetical protein
MQVPDANIRSSSYYVAQTNAQCERCNRTTRVIALALPPRHETRLEGRWQRVVANAFIFYVTELPRPVYRHLLRLSPLFSRKRGEGELNPYWANHCEHCGAMLNDDVLHCEPGGFMPSLPAQAEAICLSHVAGGFSALAAGYALDPQFFSLMPRR